MDHGGAASTVQATVAVDGLDITFDSTGPTPCSISDEALTYSYVTGDNEVTLDSSLFTIEGDTAMNRGPMPKQPANDGSQPPPVEVGTGIVIATC